MFFTMKLKSRKGFMLTFPVIVTAILALVILVILIYMVSSGLINFSSGLESCAGKGGQCYEEECGSIGPEIKNTDCPEEKPYCCMKLGG